MKTAGQRKAWALQICLQAKMRLTPIRESILTFLATQHLPVSLEAVMQAEGIQGSCNAATAYRTLMLLRELEVIRQVSLPNKISHFVLNIPGESTHFLVCRCCGALSELPVVESLSELEGEIASSQGYARLYHELVFHGFCPFCQKHPPGMLCAKVQPRMRLTRRFTPGPANPN
jgi:Fur family transcriptional regulator, peroxide stress response regulator